MKRVVVGAKLGGLPLDRALAALTGDADAAGTIGSGRVFVDGLRVIDPGSRARPGQKLVVHARAPAAPAAPQIIYEDEAIIALDKRPGEHLNETETSVEWALVELLRARFADVHVVHRLDRETSGVVVLAKDHAAAVELSEAFQRRVVDKTYLAIVEARALPPVVDAPIGLDPRRPRARRVAADGEPAQTALVGGAPAFGLQLVRALPRTGRTHQIRVHLASVGAPIVGDRTYGGLMAARVGDAIVRPTRTLLHALRLALPGRPPLERPLHADFAPFLAAGLTPPSA